MAFSHNKSPAFYLWCIAVLTSIPALLVITLATYIYRQSNYFYHYASFESLALRLTNLWICCFQLHTLSFSIETFGARLQHKNLKSDSSLKESKKIFCFICDISVIALVSIFPMLLLIHLTFLHFFLHPHMHEIYLQLYCMKCFPRNPQKEMVN